MHCWASQQWYPFSKHILKNGVVLSGIVLAACAVGVSDAAAAALRAGAAAANITLDPPTATIHDPLLAKVLVVDDGTTKVVIIGTDLGQASSGLTAQIRSRLREELGIVEKNVLVNGSHNHHCQGQVAKDVVERIVKAVKQAAGSMVPVRIGVGAGHEDRITINRRLRMKDGHDWTIRRANPSPLDSEVTGLGPLDPEIGILRLDRLDGRRLAVVYNFAGHAYGGVPNGGVTADFPGFASKVLEEAMGGQGVALFLQGFAGDVTPVRYKDVDVPPPTEQLGTMLGMSTLAAANRLDMKDAATIRVAVETVELPRRKAVEARVKALEKEQEKLLKFFTGVGCGTHGAGTFLNFKTFLPLYMKHKIDPDWPAYSSYLYKHEQATGRNDLELLDTENKKRVEKYLQCIYNMEKLIRVRSKLQGMKRHLRRDASVPVEIEIQGIRIGHFVLVTYPGEPFAEIGLRIKKQSPFEYTFVAGYSNGAVGYSPTADAYESCAYEDMHSQLAPEWQAIYEKKALEIIHRLQSPQP